MFDRRRRLLGISSILLGGWSCTYYGNVNGALFSMAVCAMRPITDQFIGCVVLYHAARWESDPRSTLFGVLVLWRRVFVAKCGLLIYADPSILAERPGEMFISFPSHLIPISSLLLSASVSASAQYCLHSCCSSSPTALWICSIHPGLALSSAHLLSSHHVSSSKRTPPVSVAQTSPESRWRCLRCPRSMGRHY